MNDLYIVLYESTNVLGKHCFAVLPKVYEEWTEADKAAKDRAKLINKRTWVAAIARPALIELVK